MISPSELNLTRKMISGTPGKVGQKQKNFEQTPARFGAGTLARIDATLAPKEKRSDFIKAAVERELKARGAPPAPPASEAPARREKAKPKT